MRQFSFIKWVAFVVIAVLLFGCRPPRNHSRSQQKSKGRSTQIQNNQQEDEYSRGQQNSRTYDMRQQ